MNTVITILGLLALCAVFWPRSLGAWLAEVMNGYDEERRERR